MSKFNNAYERLYEYWSYGWAIDYNVEEQLDDWFTLNEEYTKLSKALDKACELIAEAVNQDCTIFDEVLESPYLYRTEAREWKEWLLKEDE